MGIFDVHLLTGFQLSQLRAETQKLTDDEEIDVSEDDGSSPEHSNTDRESLLTDHHAFVLGYRSSDVDLRKLHPLPSQIPFIWQVYVENVDPLVKILHIPTMNPIIRKIRSDMDNLPPGLEALMFSIYYAAITSLEDDEVSLPSQSIRLIMAIQAHRYHRSKRTLAPTSLI